MTLHRHLLATLVFGLICSVRAYPQCSIVSLEGPATIKPGEVLKVTAKVSTQRTKDMDFKWQISSGTITSDPHGADILVDTVGLSGQSIVVTVEVSGIPTDCLTTAFLVTTVEVREIICGIAFDEYGDIKFRDEKARLDNFAIQILNEPGSRGYLLAYAGQRTYPNEAAERLKRAKNYLVDVRHVPRERIITVDGGHRQELVVTLRVLPVGESPPAADAWGLLTMDKLDFSKPHSKTTTRRRNHWE